VRTKLLKFKPNILDEVGPCGGSGDVRILRPSLNSLRFLFPLCFKRLIFRSCALTRPTDFWPMSSWVSFGFSRSFTPVLGYVR